jgi:hypothetical protein
MLHLAIGRPESLPAETLGQFPELAAIRFRRGGIPPRVAGWLLGQSSVAAVTLWHTIWLGKSTVADDELLLHEARHVAQFEASPAFPFLYLWESLRRGYRSNRYEVDAQAYAARRLGGVQESNPVRD